MGVSMILDTKSAREEMLVLILEFALRIGFDSASVGAEFAMIMELAVHELRFDSPSEGRFDILSGSSSDRSRDFDGRRFAS
jgi:hypothetical protein